MWPLIRDSKNSIRENVEIDDDPSLPRKPLARSTPKTRKRTLPKTSAALCDPDLNEFLKVNALVKKLKLVSFDPFKEKPTEWISKFETETGKHSSVKDLGFNNVLHLIKIDEAKNWQFSSLNTFSTSMLQNFSNYSPSLMCCFSLIWDRS